MGRFKIYDSKELVNVLNDSNYASCLLCERKLKNIMGNIKRHYEQMHSVFVNSNVNKTRKTRKKSEKIRGDDKDYKIPTKGRKSADISNPNGMPINNIYRTKPTELPTANPPIISDATNNVSPASMLPISESTEYYQLGWADSKRKFDWQENAVESNQPIAITPTSKEMCPIDSFAPAVELQENEAPDLHLPKTNQKKIKLNKENEEIQIPCYSYISNVQIDSMDSCHPLEFIKCLVETKTHVNIPLKIFQKADTFEKALQFWKPNFQFNYSSQTIGEHIDRMAKKLRQEIIKMVSNRLIYLKLDLVSSTQGNLMFVNIQFINDFEIKVITLSALQLSDDDLATYVKQKVLTTLVRYKIDIGRVRSIIKDNTNNFRNSLTLNDNGTQINILTENMDESSIFPQFVDYGQNLCHNFSGHAIHFVATDIIKQLSENISQSRDSAKKLRSQMSQLNIKEMPMLDYPTSWFSVYDMIDSLLKIREIVENNQLLMTEVDWLFATKFVESFKPIVDTALMLQTDDIFTMGDFYREWLLCDIKLEELSGTNEIALYLLAALRKRKSDLFENTSFLSALYLDPRFCYKESIYLSDKQKQQAIDQLLQIFCKLQAINIAIKSTNLTDINLNNRYSKLEKLTAASFEIDLDKTSNYNTVCWTSVDSLSVKEAIEQLQFGERLPFTANILEHWHMLKYKSPILAKIAEVALAAPATKATINRALNISSINLIRRKLIENTDNAENLLLLKLNQDLVNKITLEN